MRRRIARAASHARAHYLPGRAPRHELAICAIFRDEAPYLAEWVAFHQLQGVDRFWLYDNHSADNWHHALAPELESGIVSVTGWSDEPGQFSAYEHCLRRHRWDARWVAFIDVDEFLFSPTGRPLPEILQRFEKHPAVVANWRVFGPGGNATPPAGPVIGSYLMRAGDQRSVNRHVKSIVQPRHTKGVANPHVFVHYGTAVDENGEPQIGPFRDPPTADLLRVNHYFSKSLEEWERKIARPRADYGERGNYALPPEDERDETILSVPRSARQCVRPKEQLRTRRSHR